MGRNLLDRADVLIFDSALTSSLSMEDMEEKEDKENLIPVHDEEDNLLRMEIIENTHEGKEKYAECSEKY